MRKALASRLLAPVAALLVSGPLGAAQESDVKAPPADEKKSETALAAIAYKPPLRGAPATRVGGGTRSVAQKRISLSVLAPNETGLTTREQPTIYWYVSETLDVPVEVTLSSTEPLALAAKPLVELVLQAPIRKGVHALSLAEHGVALKPGVEYQWFVAAVGNAAQRSNDVIAGGTIQRVAESDAVRARVKEASPAGRPALYAGEGLWYDAIDELSRLISAQPENRELRASRAALLEQVGLPEAAAFDRAALR